jgi:hypothetical protein
MAQGRVALLAAVVAIMLRPVTGRHQRMQFNHVATRLDSRYFDTVVEMMTSQLGFVVLRRTERSIWLRQPGTNVDLQFSRSDTANRDADKRRSQVSFLSETPHAALSGLAAWAKAHEMEASVGSYSDREFFLDAPEAFVDFVIEAMLPELADYDVEVT